MVEYTLELDNIFSSLADPTRRDILKRVALEELAVSDIAKAYNMTLAAISKHLKVLEKAKLIIKRRQGKQQFIHFNEETLIEAANYLEEYKKILGDRFKIMDEILENEKKKLLQQ